MHILKAIPAVAALAVSAAAFTGCNTDNLCYPVNDGPHTAVNVAFDWSNAPDANPQGMRVAFHPIDSDGDVLRFDLPGRTGGPVYLNPGTYAVLSYNNDTENIGFGNADDWQGAYAHTFDASVLDPMGIFGNTRAEFRPVDDEPVRGCPDRAWRAAVDTIQINNSTTQTISLSPARMYCDYDFRISHVSGLEHARFMSASITGMADGANLSSGSLSTRRCTHAVPAVRGDSSTIAGEFRVFGHNPADTTHHMMELYVITDNGRQLRIHGDTGSRWDVTSQVEKAPDPRHVSLLIDGVDIPYAAGGDTIPPGGFNPQVSDWDDVHVTIPL